MSTAEVLVALVTATLSALTSWPVAVVTLGLLFRKPLHQLLPRLVKVSARGVQADFGDALGRAETAVDEAIADVPGPGLETEAVPSVPDDESLASQSGQSPSYTLLRAWNMLEEQLRSLATVAGAVTGGEAPLGFLLARLEALSVINDRFSKAVEDLRHLRNEVAHGRHSPSEGEAIAYLDSAVELTRACGALIRLQGQRTPLSTPPKP